MLATEFSFTSGPAALRRGRAPHSYLLGYLPVAPRAWGELPCGHAAGALPAHAELALVDHRSPDISGGAVIEQGELGGRSGRSGRSGGSVQDRKSTRLNSSHVASS